MCLYLPGGLPRRLKRQAMSWGKKFFVVCATIIGGLYTAYLVILPTAYLRYRLSLEVDVDGVTHTGSGVVEIAYQPLPDWLVNIGGGSHFGGDMRGCAITVDLGERGLLFVVNSRPFLEDPKTHLLAFPKLASLNMLPFVAYRLPQDYDPSSGLAAVRELQTKQGSVEIPPDGLPMVVRFRNINDGDTLEELDPRDLAAAYGAGARLARARFEFTTDSVSSIPKTWPKWLASAHFPQYSEIPGCQNLTR
jgi:hypothetical protein